MISQTDSYLLLFVAPMRFTGDGVILAAVCGLATFRLSYAFLDLPHNALLAVLPASSNVRTAMAAQRQIFGSLAGVALSSALGAAFVDRGGGVDLALLNGVALGLAVSSFVVVFFCARLVRPFETSTPSIQAPHSGTRAAFAAFFTSPRYLAIVGIAFVSHATIPAFSKAAGFLQSNAPGPFPGATLVALTLGHAASAMGWSAIAARTDKMATAVLAFVWTGMVSLAFGLHALGGVDGKALLAAAGLLGVGVGGVFTLIWALLPDAIEAARRRHDLGLEATGFGVFTFANKAGLGLCAAIVGLLLEGGGQNAAALAGILPPILGSAICVFLILHLQKNDGLRSPNG